MQTANSSALHVIMTFDTKHGILFEKTIHGRFDSKRLNGEWFELNAEDIEQLPEILKLTEHNLSIINKELL